MPILNDVLARTPANWTPTSYSSKVYCEVEVHGEEKNDVLVNFPSDLKNQVTSVYRIQNPYMWGRFILRKEQLQAKGKSAQEATYYHPISRVDKAKVMEYNLDYRRYTHKNGYQYDSGTKKPYLYSDPKYAKDRVSHEPVVVVVKTTTDYAYGDTITKDWDTEYYPEYFVEF